MRSWIASMICLAAVSLVQGEKPAPLLTDRPDQTESSGTVPENAIQIETGFVRERDGRRVGCADDETLFSMVSGTLLRYGLTDWLELRWEGRVAYERTRGNSGRKNDYFGATGMGVGAKAHLWDEEGLLPDAGLIAGVDIPVAGPPVCDPDLEPETVEPGVLLAFAHTLSTGLGFSYNLGVSFLDAGTDWIYSAALGIGLSERLGSFVEVYGGKSPGAAAALFFDAGMTFLIRPNLQWDVSFGVAVTEDASGGFVSTGVSIRLPE